MIPCVVCQLRDDVPPQPPAAHQDNHSAAFHRLTDEVEVVPLGMEYLPEAKALRVIGEVLDAQHVVGDSPEPTVFDEHPVPSKALATIQIRSESKYVGKYYFFLFSYELKGIEDKSSLEALVFSRHNSKYEPRVSEKFFSLVQSGEVVKSDYEEYTELLGERFSQVQQKAQRQAVSERNRREHELRRSNDALVNARQAAIEQTYRIKLRNVRRYLEEATDERIRRMRVAQLRNLEAKYNMSKQDIEAQRQIRVSFSIPIAGALTIVE